MRFVLAAVAAVAANAATITWTGSTGSWNTTANWDLNRIPIATDDVVIGGGEAWLDSDASVNSIQIGGGANLVLATTSCPDGWTATTSLDGCLAGFSTALPWLEAEASCVVEAGVADPPVRGHLALIGDEERNRLASVLCASLTSATALRVEDDGVAESQGLEYGAGSAPCWIGLSDNVNASGRKTPAEVSDEQDETRSMADDGSMAWVNEGAVEENPLFRAWALREPKMRDSATNCGAVLHRGYDAHAERPRWRSADCSLALPYVCSRRATTFGYTLTVDSLDLQSGTLRGRGTLVATTTAVVVDGDFQEGASFVATDLTFTGSGGSIVNGDGDASILVSGACSLNDVTLRGLDAGGYASARLVTAGTVSMSGAVLNWFFQPTAVISGDGELYGGGDLSQGVFAVPTELRLEGRATTLRSSTTMLLSTHADARVVLEDYEYDKSSTSDLEKALGVGDDAMARRFSTYRLDQGGDGDLLVRAKGSFRLAVSGQQTDCLPWHASAREVQDALNNVTESFSVDRRGDGSRRWGYGYTYEVVFDGADPGLALDCVGAGSCGCYEPLRQQRESNALSSSCEKSANYLGLCLARADAEVTLLRGGSEAVLSGSGALVIGSGVHALASDLAVARLVVDGVSARVLVASSAFTALAIEVNSGTLSIGGAGFRGEDACDLLFAAADAPWRRALTEEDMVPTFSSTATSLRLTGGELRLCSRTGNFFEGASDSELVLDLLTWKGGSLRGNGRVRVTDTSVLNIDDGELASATDGVELALAAVEWEKGDLSFTRGASVLLSGLLRAYPSAGSWYASTTVQRQQEDPLLGPYAENPACGPMCGLRPQMRLTPDATFKTLGGAFIIVEMELFTRGLVEVDAGSSLTLGEGGAGDGSLSVEGALKNRNGLLDLTSLAITTDDGEIRVGGGEVLLPVFLEPRLVVEGGVASMEGAVSLTEVVLLNGTLRATNVANVTVTGSCTVQGASIEFPRQLSKQDIRSSFNIKALNMSRGATISGNVDVNAHGNAVVDTAFLLHDACFINHAELQLISGDITTDDSTAHVDNRGTVEVLDSSLFRGVVGRPTPGTQDRQYEWEDNIPS